MQQTTRPRVSVRGELADRMKLTAEQFSTGRTYTADLVAQDLVLEADRRRTADDYSGDLSGRYLEAVALAAELGFEPAWERLEGVLTAVITAQRFDGSYGPQDAAPGGLDHGVAWGNAFLLQGLMAVDALLGEGSPLAHLAPGVRDAATRLADSIVTALPRWIRWFEHPAAREHKFALDFFAALAPLVRWATEHGDVAAEQAAARLADLMPTPDGPWHLHGYLLALRGKLQFSRAFRGGADDAGVLEAWGVVRSRYVLAHGGVRESMREEPLDRNTEGCGIADWIMLSLELGEAFDYAELFESAEIALHNALAHVQAPSGHFGCETLTDDPGLLVVDYVPEAWWCCTFHCFKALHHAATRAVEYREGEGVRVNLLIPVDVEIPGVGEVRLRTDYPSARFTVQVEQSDAVPVRLRESRLHRIVGLPSAGGAIDLPSNTVAEGECTTWIDIDGLPIASFELNITDESAPWAAAAASVFVGPLVQTLATPRTGGGDVVTARTITLRPDGHRIRHGDEEGLAHVRGLVREFTTRWSPLAAAPGASVEAPHALTRFRFAGISLDAAETP